MNLNIENAVLDHVTRTPLGRVYSVSYSHDVISVIAKFDNSEDEELANLFEDEVKTNSNISVIKDENRVLALRSEFGTLIFARGYIDNKIDTAYDNIDYVIEKYSLTYTEFLDKVEKQLSSGTLKLK